MTEEDKKNVIRQAEAFKAKGKMKVKLGLLPTLGLLTAPLVGLLIPLGLFIWEFYAMFHGQKAASVYFEALMHNHNFSFFVNGD